MHVTRPSESVYDMVHAAPAILVLHYPIAEATYMATQPDSLPSVTQANAPHAIAQAITDFIAHIPDSNVPHSHEPTTQAYQLAARASRRAALTAGSLALPPGPLGWLTVLPELITIWKIQAQLVSDIAAAYGKQAQLAREQMLWCLFRHTTAQAFRDLAVRMGDRWLFQTLSYSALQRLSRHIGIKLSQRAIGKGITRWLPIVGALGVAAYAYYDTKQVAQAAIELFGSTIDQQQTS